MRVNHFLILILAVLLQACAGSTTKTVKRDIANDISQAEVQSQALLDLVKHNKRQQTPLIRGARIDTESTKVLPPEFDNRASLPLLDNNSELASMQFVAGYASKVTGYPVIYGRMSPPKTTGQQTNIAPGKMLPGAVLTGFDGTVKQLLDYAAGLTGLSWRFNHDKRSIYIYKYDTKTWPIFSMNVEDTLRVEQGKGSDISTRSEAKLNAFEDLKQSLDSIVSQEGSFSFTPTMSMLTVTEQQHVLDSIDSLITSYNDRSKKQIAFNFELYAIQLNATENYGIGADIQWSGNDAAVGFGTEPTVMESLLTGGFSVINGDSPFSGSQTFFNAVSSIGDTSLVASTSGITMNATPIVRVVGGERGFLTKVEQTLTADVGVSTSGTIEQVADGVHVRIYPSIVNDHEVMLDITVSLTTIQEPNTFDFGTTVLTDVPKSKRDLQQRVLMQSGDTLVISDYDAVESGRNNEGLGSSDNWLLGGSKNSSQSRILLVARITSRIL